MIIQNYLVDIAINKNMQAKNIVFLYINLAKIYANAIDIFCNDD